jgi:glycosyltransferase involved in cell wall biosynthesis
MPESQYLDYLRYQRFPTDKYIAISQSQAKALRTLVTVVGVVYNGIDISAYDFNRESGEYLLFVGRYMPEKGVKDAIDAALATNTQTILAGSKEYRALPYFKEYIEPAEKSGVIRDIGFVTGKKKSGLFGSAKALLFPIHWEEPFGMVMTEAMACGTPVIAYNRGSVSEIVHDGVTGFIIDEDDAERPNKGNWVIKKQGVEGLVEAIQRIGEIDRAKCRERVEEAFTVAHMVSGYEAVYKKILGSV